MSIDVDLVLDTVTKIVNRMEVETASLIDSHGRGFASSVMANVGAQIAGMALALVKDDEMRKNGKLALLLLIDRAADQKFALFETIVAIDRAKK